jgi:prepilin-type N-terminal cleavage/methylation domain-containing protein
MSIQPIDEGNKEEPTMIRSRKNAGFTLIELMIVVAIIAIIASIAIPKLMSARLAANEAAAIATLRSVSSAQAQIQSSGAIDTDADGAGEYAYFAELAGSVPMRVSNNAVPGPAFGVPGAAGVDVLSPSILPSAFGNVTASLVSRSGYYFEMFLPDLTFQGIAEDATGGGAASVGGGATNINANNSEIMWCCYAWPMDVGATGNRAFFVNQEGDLLQCQNRQATPFTGTTGGGGVQPTFDDAYQATDMSTGLRVGSTGGPSGSIWTPVQ